MARLPRRRGRLASGFSIGRQRFIQTGLAGSRFQDPYYFAVSLSAGRFAVFFLLAELTINTVFACLYLAVPGCVLNMRPGVFTDAFFFSLETLATVGYGFMAPATLYGHVVSAIEIVTGVAFTGIMTGLLFLRFSRPRARIVYADHPLVTAHNGRPTLMLRLGNARASFLTKATFTLHAMTLQVSEEGRELRSIQELALLRNQLPIFAILATLMHVIDNDSPLHGLDADALHASDMRLFVTISARDEITGQEVSDFRMFYGGDVKFGVRYVDAIRTVGGDQTIADYAQISAVEADGTG